MSAAIDVPAAPVRRDSPLPLYAVLVGSLLLRLSGLGARGIWTDEGSTWSAASAPLQELIRLCAEKDASPPLFYLLTSLALKFGDNEAWLRAVSVVASVAMVWLTYRIARLAAGRTEATLAAMLTALSSHQIMFAQEARTYMLVGCFATASLYLFARAVLFDRPRAWIPFVLVTALGFWTQSIALLGIGVQGALILFTAAGRRAWWRWGLAVGAALLLYAPWLAISAAQASHLGQSHWYLETPGGHEVFQVLRSVFLSPIPLVTPPKTSVIPGLEAFLPRIVAHALLVLLPAVPLAVSLGSARGSNPRGVVVRFALAGLVLPLLAVYAVSFRTPLWLPRYFVFLTPMLAVLLARGLWSLKPPPLSAVWTTLLLVASGYACFRYQVDYTKEPWKEAVAHISAVSTPGHTAALVPFDVDPYRYYNRRQAAPVAAFEVSHPAVPFASGWTEEQLETMERQARERVKDYDDVWVVVRSPNSDFRRDLVQRTERAAATDGRVLAGREIWTSMTGPLRLARFRREAADTSRADSTSVR